MTGLDEESRSALVQLAGGEHDIPEPLRGRLRGDDLRSLRADAIAMRAELGLEPLDESQPRGEGGRFAGDMNSKIRRAAGRL